MAAPSLALIPSAYKVGKVASVKPINGKGDFTFTRNSEATRINENGIIETMGVDVPRIDHTDGGCPSLLLEPASTNLIIYSEDFSASYWNKDGTTVSSTEVISPMNNLTTVKLEATETNQPRIEKLIPVPSTDTIYTWSVYVKKGSTDFVALAKFSGSNNAVFNLANGTLVYETGTLSTSIEAVSDGWYRVSMTVLVYSTDTYNVLKVTVTDGSSYSSGVIGEYIYLWGAQLEALSYPTSYIPTSGTTVTRAVEVCNGAGDVSTFNSSEGVLFIESSLLIDDDSNKYISLTDTADENKVQIDFDYSSSRIQYVVISDSVVYCNIKSTYVGTNTDKIAVKWKVNDFAIWINGVEVGTDTSGSAPISLDTLKFSSSGGSNNFEGNVKQVQVFKTALTDAELIALTSWSSFTEMATALKYSIK